MQGTQAPVRLALNHVQYIVVSVGRWQTVLSQNEVDVRPLLLGEKSRTFPYRSDALGWLHGDECSQALWGGRGSRSTQRHRRTASALSSNVCPGQWVRRRPRSLALTPFRAG